jgi:hypothetical protein
MDRSHSTKLYERPIVVKEGSIKTVGISAVSDSGILEVWIPNLIVFLNGFPKVGQFGFLEKLRPFHSILFESNSRLTRIESNAFHKTSLQSVLIPNNVGILGSNCFSCCKSLSSITFESNSRVTRIESEAFSYSSLKSTLVPNNVEILCRGWFTM